MSAHIRNQSVRLPSAVGAWHGENRLVLSLSAYAPVRWVLTLDPGAKLAMVLSSGYSAPRKKAKEGAASDSTEWRP